ncbi:MAG TPA: carboxypeptidase-like regulatory domain-containing protein, partial [Planctomycetota bacterium]|nr:carboxypeptidase-like regulatory domain-containing protein [Planctomycetota bacterium]
MRDRDPNPSGHSPRPRAALVLGAVAAIEAVAIVLLVMTRTAEPERAPTLRAPTEQAEPAVPTFAPPSVDRERGAARSTDLGAPPNAEPQPLAAPRADTGAVGLVLCGTVTVDDGRPLGECTVEVDEGPIEVHVPVHQGTYSVAGLEPGVCTVSCSADGCLSRPLQVALDASRPIERLDLRLERLPVIPVRIRTPEGRSLLELFDEAKLPGRLRPSVTLQAPSPQAPFGEEVSANWTDFVHGLADSPGEAELKTAGWDGVLRVQVRLPVYVNLVWDRRVLATQSVSTASAGVSFTVDFEALMRELSQRALHRLAAVEVDDAR